MLILLLLLLNNLFGATIQCDPLSASRNTGSCASNRISDTSEVRGYRKDDGWFKFDISSIPSTATINSVEFYGYVNNTYWPSWSMTPVTNDPVTADAGTLHGDIIAEATTGYYLYRDETEAFSTGWMYLPRSAVSKPQASAAALIASTKKGALSSVVMKNRSWQAPRLRHFQ